MTKYLSITTNAGHSQKVEGATGNGYEEHDEALKYNNDYIEELRGYGVKVTNTTSEASSQKAVLVEQVKKANAVSKTGRLDVSWHFNSAADKSATGVEVLYYDNAQKQLATDVSVALSKALGLRDRGAKQRKDLYFLANTNAPAILIEVAFISNANDMKAATTKRDAAVKAVVEVTAGKKTTSKPATAKGIKTNVHETEFKNTKLYFAYDNEKNSYAKVLFRLSTSNSKYDEIPLYPKAVNDYYIIQAKTDIQLYSDSNLTKKYNRKIVKGDQAVSKHLKHINK
ncbi:N-acetylmuramoyl-L-alanine amidase [Listeria monocytogenes]|nr:N-acetylmuramoyl-L-alanine amidase [Listeria monocytogenes]EKA2553076.1 N-acetylmuramoyl-L-alanine amidase [Listeria monocytogenes]EKA2556234.1 N-acetylmuramoyl-L-alanine amidase [Listeria monocytogenes]EKA2559358.1 N-acetylmuramoyl-L-alanine amidase [Listeria monocytogenes]EKA2562526.1 N-acetylmuramoyl-L-alanine amidase [Listeria monocytogenes]